MKTSSELAVEPQTSTKTATFDRTGIISALGKKYAVALLTVFALVLRLTDLNVGYWYDEGFTGHLSRLAPGAILDFLAREDVHPPLYFLFARF